MKRLAFTIFFAALHTFAHAQVSDTTGVKDSLKVYRDIERMAKKRPLTYLLYKSIINLPKPEVKQERFKKAKEPNYDRYAGRVIRNVYISSLDPFGYSVRDTARRPKSLLEKGGNWLHVKSFPFTIKNQFLFKRGDKYDPLVVKETERILRQSRHIHDASITPVRVPGTKDSVDLYVRTQDVWSIEGGAAWSPSSWSADVGQFNFLGTSHQIRERVKRRGDGDYEHFGSYTIPYLRNTFITANGFYSKYPTVSIHGLTLSRGFYSTLTKWMGGIALSRTMQHDTLRQFPDFTFPFRLRYGTYDFWAGYSIPIIKKGVSDEERGSNFIITGRNHNIRYMIKPEAVPDSLWPRLNHQYYFVGLGLSSRSYYRDYYIYRFGVPEDIPTGRLVNVVLGQELTETSLRWYTGIQCGIGTHVPDLGYTSLHGYYGTFINRGKHEQSVFHAELGYFTDLVQLNRWRLRQFIRFRYTTGVNRRAGEQLYITGDQGLRGFNSEEANGRQRFVINFQTQLYAPWDVIGFRFAPIVFLGVAWVGDGFSESLLKTRMYQNYGLGLLIKNEYLIWETFQVTAALYPYVPGRNDALFKYNPVRTHDFSFRDFTIDRPAILSYY